MDEGKKILLVNLAKGKIGEDAASLLGALLDGWRNPQDLQVTYSLLLELTMWVTNEVPWILLPNVAACAG